MQNTFNIKDALSFGWKKFTENTAFFLLLTLGFLIVSGILDKASAGILSRILAIFVGYFAMFTFVKVGMKTFKGEKATVKDVFEIDWNLFGIYVLGAILFTIAYTVGLFLLIIPGIIAIVRLGFFAFIIIEEKQKPIESLKKSYEMTTGYFWHILGFSIVLAIVNLLGAIPMGLGLLITAPVCLLATVYVYEKIKHNPMPKVIVVEPVKPAEIESGKDSDPV